MKKIISSLFIILLIASCSSGDKKGIFAKSSIPEDKLFEFAEKNLANKDYELAVDNFNEFLDSYPASARAVDAELKIADAQFLAENYLEAQYAYEQFINSYPWNKNIAYARYQLALGALKQYRDVRRDQAPLLTALRKFQDVVAKHPGTEYAEKSILEIERARNLLAEYEMMVARFYIKRGERPAAVRRLRDLTVKYPETSPAKTATEMLAADFTKDEIERSRINHDRPNLEKAARRL